MGLLEGVWELASPKALIALVVGSYAIYACIQRLYESYRLRKLGARAAAVPYRLPYALDFIYSAVQATIKHRNLENWQAFFNRTGVDSHGNGSYTLEVRAFDRRLVFTADHENIKAVLATQFAEFGKGEPFHQEWEEFLGDGIFATDGHLWHTSRQLLRPQFIKDRVSDLHCFESHLETFLKAMANGGPLSGEDQQVDLNAVNGRVMDISDLFFRYTLDVATDFLLGRDVKSLR
jgi:cytochrome P450